MVKEVLFGAAGVLAVVAIYAAVRYLKSKQEENDEVEKVYLDEVNVGEIKNWFKGKLVNGKQKGVVFYPTKENLEKWKIKMTPSQNLLIQLVYDTEEDKVIAYREITFAGVGEKLKALLDENGGTLVVEQ